METRGWHVDRQQRPDRLHLMINPNHAAIVEGLPARSRRLQWPSCAPILAWQPAGNAALYGLLARLPERGQVSEALSCSTSTSSIARS